MTVLNLLIQAGSSDEIGKIFSLVSSLESAFPILTGPILTLIYNSTLDAFPGASYLYLSGINFASGLLMLLVRHWTKGEAAYTRVRPEEEEESESAPAVPAEQQH